MNHHHTTVTGCRHARTGTDCLADLAAGTITLSDLCPACTRQFIGAIDERTGRANVWHRDYARRATGGAA